MMLECANFLKKGTMTILTKTKLKQIAIKNSLCIDKHSNSTSDSIYYGLGCESFVVHQIQTVPPHTCETERLSVCSLVMNVE